MADNTHIEWTDATWNIITGCSLASPGCTNCYAMRLAGSRIMHHPSRAGLTTPSKAGPVWNGQVRFNAEWLTQPLQWKRPRKVFVCAHGDLFHESVPDAWIDQVFAVMALAPQHTFQVLTKRSARMREYFRPAKEWGKRVAGLLNEMKPSARWNGNVYQGWQEIHGKGFLPNIWLGVSVEDQKRAGERIPDLLATPAAVRWISAEPLLGPVDLERLDLIPWLNKGKPAHEMDPHVYLNALSGHHSIHPIHGVEQFFHRGLDWVVVGGESGQNARPMHPDWARSLRDQCASAGVPFLFKQWGAWLPFGQSGFTAWGADTSRKGDLSRLKGKWWGHASFNDGAGGPTIETIGPVETLIVGNQDKQVVRLGKARAGRLLDGIEHNGYPEAR